MYRFFIDITKFENLSYIKQHSSWKHGMDGSRRVKRGQGSPATGLIPRHKGPHALSIYCNCLINTQRCMMWIYKYTKAYSDFANKYTCNIVNILT